MAKKKNKPVEEPKVEGTVEKTTEAETTENKPVEEPKVEVQYRVKEGCSLVCKRGILTVGKVALAKYFPNGEKDLEFHAKEGGALEKVKVAV